MKRFYLLLVAAFAIPVLGISSATVWSQKSGESSQFGTEVKKHECKIAAENCPKGELRVYAQGVSSNEDFAEEKALHYAKGKIVSKIQSLVKEATKSYMKDIGMNDEIINLEELEKTVSSSSEGVISNYKVVCSKLYQLDNGNYKCHICISVPYGKVDTVAETAMIKVMKKNGKQINQTKAQASRQTAYQKYLEDKANR